MKITTPVVDYSGFVGRVQFEQGVGFADPVEHAAEIGYMRANGYTIGDVADLEPETELEPASPVASTVPRKTASTAVWREYALAHGVDADEADQMTRDQLASRFTTKEDSQ